MSVTSRVFIHVSKGSGNNLVEVVVNGYFVSDNTLLINEIRPNAKFVTDVERLKFSVGLKYSMGAIADFFLAERGFTTGKVVVGEATAVDLSTYAGSPNMSVEGNSVVIADGDASPSSTDHTDFGTVTANSATQTRTFTIKNIGEGTLNLTGTPVVAVGGANAADFEVTVVPQTQIPPAGSVTFEVTFTPTSTGSLAATLSIANDDPASNKNPYNFAIGGTGA